MNKTMYKAISYNCAMAASVAGAPSPQFCCKLAYFTHFSCIISALTLLFLAAKLRQCTDRCTTLPKKELNIFYEI